MDSQGKKNLKKELVEDFQKKNLIIDILVKKRNSWRVSYEELLEDSQNKFLEEAQYKILENF